MQGHDWRVISDTVCLFLSFAFYLWSTDSTLRPWNLENDLQASWLWIIKKWLQKCEVTISNDFFAFVDAFFPQASKYPSFTYFVLSPCISALRKHYYHLLISEMSSWFKMFQRNNNHAGHFKSGIHKIIRKQTTEETVICEIKVLEFLSLRQNLFDGQSWPFMPIMAMD